MIPLSELFTRYSTLVVLFLTGLAAYWLQLPVDEQQALMLAYPWLKHVVPAAGLVAFLVARGAKQSKP